MVYGYGARLEIRLGVERKSVDVEEFYPGCYFGKTGYGNVPLVRV